MGLLYRRFILFIREYILTYEDFRDLKTVQQQLFVL